MSDTAGISRRMVDLAAHGAKTTSAVSAASPGEREALDPLQQMALRHIRAAITNGETTWGSGTVLDLLDLVDTLAASPAPVVSGEQTEAAALHLWDEGVVRPESPAREAVLATIAVSDAPAAEPVCSPECGARADCARPGAVGHSTCGRCPICGTPRHHACEHVRAELLTPAATVPSA